MKIVIMLTLLFGASDIYADEKSKKGASARGVKNEQFSTSFDFEESVLQGKMKVPLSVMLKGRREGSKGQIIELRRNFRNELRSSRPGVLQHSK